MSRALQTLRLLTAEPDQSDGQLLEAYAARRDGAAFAELVRRHGPMVWGVCRRALPNRQDAEDAFQATFLVLVRKPGAVRPPDRVGNWLHGVAVRTAQKAGKVVSRRREHQVESLPEPETVAEGIWHDLVPVLDREVARLPEKYRLPVVLCDLEGSTRREAAARLGWPEGTVAGRLALGRAMLARRLARHGLAVSGGVLATVLSGPSARAVAPAQLFGSTIRTAAGGAFRPGVTVLAEEVLRAMSATRFIALAAVVVVAAIGGGMALWAQPIPGDRPSAVPVKRAPAPAKAKDRTVDIAWGQEVNGLQAGVGFAPARSRPYQVGETVTLAVFLRNVSGREMTFEYADGFLYEEPPTVVDAAGKPVSVSYEAIGGERIRRRQKLTLAAGEVVEVERTQRLLSPDRGRRAEPPTIYVGPGRYKVSFSGVPPHDKPAPAARLSTGQIDMEVVVETLTPVFGQDGWRFAATYLNTTTAVADLPTLLRESSIVLDGKTYPRQILKFAGNSKLPPGERWAFSVGAVEYLGRDFVLGEGKHTLTLKFGGQEFGPVEFEWRK
ncbi:RNA polymerase sigma factor [Frigoriglobus tundricola]|uniref:ECF RNA polymerase sigma factor SigE n=1 Tax=Frigoriglobus tundricola TaxID=2774151 RepID=A0A6M5YVT7_9BACT|nr:sigma-70 family RNA polymerase sigma factor [Frigoriglobus tundricola]QJW97012.1 hypothetical protein FTUN_4572 [Frigoriglobus tundricola]